MLAFYLHCLLCLSEKTFHHSSLYTPLFVSASVFFNLRSTVHLNVLPPFLQRVTTSCLRPRTLEPFENGIYS